MKTQGIGAPIKRREDRRFLLGSGRYTDDITLPGCVYAAFVRSPHAHAKITNIDSDQAASMPGVRAVLTGSEFATAEITGLICGWMIHSSDGSPMKVPPHLALANDVVKHVGDQVAVVIAETNAQARDAADAVEVTYDSLPCVVDPATACSDGVQQIYDDIPNNRAFHWEIGDSNAVDAAFTDASHITRMEIINNRLIPNALEPRSALGHHAAADDRYTLYTTSQNPHVARLVLSAFGGVAPEHKLRVIAPDVGGGFGSKIYVYPEEIICLWASKQVGAPVKWTATRSESFITDAHGRDHVTTAEMAFGSNQEILGLRVNTTANMGAYLSLFASCVPTYLYATLLSGVYAIENIHCTVDAVYTNTTPVDAYRGAGRPEACYVLERLMEQAARELEIDPAELRRINLIRSFPHQTPVIMNYDCGDFETLLNTALEASGYSTFSERRAASEKVGKKRGIGLSMYIEACGIAPSAAVGSLGAGVGLWESAEIRVNPTGSVEILTGSHSHGQGHETTFAQIVADRLGIDIDSVSVVHGDTDVVQFGMGTYGSRSGPVGASAIVKAMEKVEAKARTLAAHLLETSESDIEIADGELRVAGTDRKKTFPEVALAAYVAHNLPEGMEPGLKETAVYDPANFTFPSGCHVCEVEIDPRTGKVEICAFIAVDDFGNVINPMIVEGQVHGGLAQGIGQALLEACVYDQETGQLLTGSFSDYCLPRADDLPSFTVKRISTPCPHNPLGLKGCGEAGAIGSSPSVINAITHAVGVKDIAMPASPHRVWQAINAAN